MASDRGRSWSSWVTLLVFVALVAGPVAAFNGNGTGVSGWQGEWQRWQAASALARYDQGEHQPSLASLETAAEKLPGDPYLQRQLIDRLCDQDRADEGLALCDQMIARQPNQPGWLQLKSTCQAKLGQFDLALKSLRSYFACFPQQLRPDRDQLNAIAYYRALAGTKLDVAAAEIQAAVNRELSDTGTLPRLSLIGKTVVAASLLSRYADVQPIALPLLDQQVAIARQQSEASDRSLAEVLLLKSQDDFPLGSAAERSVKGLRLIRDADRKGLARLLAARALVFEDMGRTQECDYDRATVIQLGFDEQDLLDHLPTDSECVYVLQRGMAFLDTRGFIHGLRPWKPAGDSDQQAQLAGTLGDKKPIASSYAVALGDLDVAIAAGQVLLATLDSPLAIVEAWSLTDLKQRKISTRETLAAMLYHRLLAHRKANQQSAAQADADQITQLGFEVGPQLF